MRLCIVAILLLAISASPVDGQEWHGTESEAEVVEALKGRYLNTRLELADAGRMIASKFGKGTETFLIRMIAAAPGAGGSFETGHEDRSDKKGLDIAYLALAPLEPKAASSFWSRRHARDVS
jgi:hypothetical protein